MSEGTLVECLSRGLKRINYVLHFHKERLEEFKQWERAQSWFYCVQLSVCILAGLYFSSC